MNALYELREHLENASNDLWLHIFELIEVSSSVKKELHARKNAFCKEYNLEFLDPEHYNAKIKMRVVLFGCNG